MSVKLTLAALPAASLALSLGLAAPASAGDGIAFERPAESATAFGMQPQSRQVAEMTSGVSVEVNHTQTVETKRLKRRRHRR